MLKKHWEKYLSYGKDSANISIIYCQQILKLLMNVLNTTGIIDKYSVYSVLCSKPTFPVVISC